VRFVAGLGPLVRYAAASAAFYRDAARGCLARGGREE
jgi:hypothetical protein